MNPLKLRLPASSEMDSALPAPTPDEIKAWLTTLPAGDTRKVGPEILGLIHGINRRNIPTTRRLQSLMLLKSRTQELVELLRSKYRNRPLPLSDKQRESAQLTRQLLEELAIGYNIIVNEAICDTADEGLNNNMFLVALRQTIVQLGQQLLECHIQYAAPAPTLWGELNRLYDFAERNGLNTLAITPLTPQEKPLTTVQHAYMRVVLLTLTQPNHLMPGQAESINNYLEHWTTGCRMEERRGTLAEAGDMLVDLDSDRPPTIATERTRFRPVKGRYFDISRLQARLAEVRANIGQETEEQDGDGSVLSLAERLRRDMLTRLTHAWAGRGERGAERIEDQQLFVLMCIGLNAAHHHVSDEADFDPEHDELRFHHPDEQAERRELELLTTQHHETSLSVRSGSKPSRLPRFDAKGDVWTTVHNTEILAREQHENALAQYLLEPWRRINHSQGGLALQRQPGNRAQMQVGSLVAFRDDNQSEHWRIGVIRWLQDGGPQAFDIGVMSLADNASAVAVRAVGGTGNGGEYFRSLLLTHATAGDCLVVPASIYHADTQLVLNRGSGIQYVQLTDIIETSSAFSLFAFETIEMPDQERNRLKNLKS